MTQRSTPVARITACVTAVAVCLMLSSALASTSSQPVFKPQLSITKSSGSIKVDGILNPDEWSGASGIKNFVERYPGDNIAPDVDTRTFITYDDDNLYVAFDCHDDPSAIRATMCQRDRFNGDDAVCVLVDTYGDASWAYQFFVNPYGIQKDRLWSSVGGEDDGFDLVWHSAAKVTESGYQVEIAIPFSSMRFPNLEEQSWRVDFWRNRPRESFHQYSWAANDRNESCWPCQWGTIDGIAGVHPGKGVEILPTYVAYQSGQLKDFSAPRSGFDNSDVMGGLSLGGKYALSSDATLEAAYNPDFSQIESDAAQVDVNTTVALFYPERRPFFQEGADVFRTLFNSFYTRTVNDPEYAVKLVSRKPGYTIGFMSAQDENTPYIVPLDERSELLNTGRSYVNALRLTKPVGSSSQLGMILTDRRLNSGGYGTIAAFDGNIRLTQTVSVDGQFLASFTGEPDKVGSSESLEGVTIGEGKHTGVFDGEHFNGNAFISRIKRFARGLSFILDYNQVEPSYRTLTGYDPWVNYRNVRLWTQYTFYPEGGIFQRIDPQFEANSRWRFDGKRRWENQSISLSTQLRWAQTSLTASAFRGSEAWTGRLTDEFIQYDGIYNLGFHAYSRPSNMIGYSFSLERGRRVARLAQAVGVQNSFNLSLDLKPFDRFLIEPDINHVRSVHADSKHELYRQFIARTRFSLQVNRELSLRLVVQYNDSKVAIYTGESDLGPSYFTWSDKVWDVDPLLTYRLSSFSVVHAGSTHDFSYFPGDEPTTGSQWKLSSRQFFVKLQYLFRV